MKFWQKVFICVLLIFVLAFNIGMFIVMHFTKITVRTNMVTKRYMYIY